MIIAITGAAGLFLTGTANAYPVKDPVLTENPLYSSGKLAETECAEPPIRNNNLKLAKRYVTALTGCLNTSWGAHFESAGLPFTKPRLKLVSKVPANYCGFEVDAKVKSQSYYCLESRTMMVQIGKDWLVTADDLWLLHATSTLYANHLMALTGIEKAFQAAPYANKHELNEQVRRANLQQDCLGGVFIRSIWDSFGRGKKDWSTLLRTLKVNGDSAGQDRTFGKGASRTTWTALGYTSSDPASCNSWAAKPSKVA